MRAALAAGAAMINDIYACACLAQSRHWPMRIVLFASCTCRGRAFDDAAGANLWRCGCRGPGFLAGRVAVLEAAGIARERIVPIRVSVSARRLSIISNCCVTCRIRR